MIFTCACIRHATVEFPLTIETRYILLKRYKLFTNRIVDSCYEYIHFIIRTSLNQQHVRVFSDGVQVIFKMNECCFSVYQPTYQINYMLWTNCIQLKLNRPCRHNDTNEELTSANRN